MDDLVAKLNGMPPRPGVYLFRDAAGQVLYIGKAKSLRSRVRSYFQESNSDGRLYLPALVREIRDLDTFVTQSEKEAAILENSLIKQHQPKFNVKLRDDKEFLTLRVDPRAEWPRLDLVRKPKSDGALYFGPYHSATSARRTLHLVEKHFRLRTCSDRELNSRTRPCLQYQIRRCPGPCVFDVDAEEYKRQLSAVGLFLDGRHDELSKQLTTRMQHAADSQEYELAATYRDQLRAVESIRGAQRVVLQSSLDQDVVGLYREGDLIELMVLSLRGGRVVDASTFSTPRAEVADDELIASYLREQYGDESGAALVPDEVIVPVLPEGADGITEWLSERRAERAKQRGLRAPRKVQLICPERGVKLQLLQMASDNARHSFEEKRRAKQDVAERLVRLQQRLRLPSVPRRIECTDISHLGGEDTVGSVVALLDGAPDKARYRTYRIRAATQGDDYAAMYEVLSRRFRRGKDAEAGEEWELPDLFLVDGGRGQLAVALAAAQDLGLFSLPLAGLAKERETITAGKVIDRVYLPGQKNPIPLKPNSPELFLLALARDEAHRFANRGRKRAGQQRRFLSELDDVPNIGPKTKQALLSRFGGMANLVNATDEEILAVPGVHRGHLRALRTYCAAEVESSAEDAVSDTDSADALAVSEEGSDVSGVGDDNNVLPTELPAEPAT
jgi:excinuclease ABC subunit C